MAWGPYGPHKPLDCSSWQQRKQHYWYFVRVRHRPPTWNSIDMLRRCRGCVFFHGIPDCYQTTVYDHEQHFSLCYATSFISMNNLRQDKTKYNTLSIRLIMWYTRHMLRYAVLFVSNRVTVSMLLKSSGPSDAILRHQNETSTTSVRLGHHWYS